MGGGPGDPGPPEPPADPQWPADPDLPDDGSPRAAPRRRQVRRAPRWVRALVVVGLGLVLVVIAAVAWYEIEAHPFGGPGHKVILEVTRGESTDSVVNQLADDGVIGSSLAFRLSFLVHGTPTIDPGAYLLHQNLPFSTVHQILGAGPNVFTVTVYPGYTLQEVANEVDDVPGHNGPAFFAEAHSGTVPSPFEPPGTSNLEGLLGTGTYLVEPGESNGQLLTAMVARFNHDAAAAGLNQSSAAALGLTEYQVVIAASIVEKEGYYVKNMGRVARVIYNRLAKGIPLQMNSTVLYPLGQDGGAVTPADLKLNSPYNSYLHVGLTPTPICFPSPAALAAAVHPAPGSWLYFVVVDKSGDEAFSDTYAEQLANEALAQRRGVG